MWALRRTVFSHPVQAHYIKGQVPDLLCLVYTAVFYLLRGNDVGRTFTAIVTPTTVEMDGDCLDSSGLFT
jgi:hypothetical protein